MAPLLPKTEARYRSAVACLRTFFNGENYSRKILTQLDTQQVGETENGRALPLRIRVDRVGPNVRLVLLQEIENVMAFP